MIEVYTDGSCCGNGRREATGGFGVIVTEDGKIIDAYSKKATGTTNNREEIKAILWALEKYGHSIPPTLVYSDSAYAINTLSLWSKNWKRNGWLKSDGKVPENLDLIKLYDIIEDTGKRIDLRKVAGHSGNYFNELADALATNKITKEEVLNIGNK